MENKETIIEKLKAAHAKLKEIDRTGVQRTSEIQAMHNINSCISLIDITLGLLQA